MTFWQENFSFIKDVYDSRTQKLVELMDKTDKAIAAVLADKIYTSNEFKKIKENFVGAVRNLDQPETKEWLTMTKDTLMSDRPHEVEDETKRLRDLIQRYDDTMPRVDDTRNVVDCLWKAYQFTDEVAPIMVWMEDMRAKSVRDVKTNSATQTEEHIEKHEKQMDQMERKSKSVLELLDTGEKIMANPKSPKFLEGHMNKFKELWAETKRVSEERLKQLRDNLAAWEKYERNRDGLNEKIGESQKHHKSMIKIFDLSNTFKEHDQRVARANELRAASEEMNTAINEAFAVLAAMASDTKKKELTDEVENFKKKLAILETMDKRLEELNTFNEALKSLDENVGAQETWLKEGRKRMDDLLQPATPLPPEERVMYTMELQSDIEEQLEKLAQHKQQWEEIKPQQKEEKTEAANEYVKRTGELETGLNSLLSEVRAEGEKFGEDIKHLADFTSGVKKFEPWIAEAEARKRRGMKKPANLQEASTQLEQTHKWQEESTNMENILKTAHESAQKMTLHADQDAKHQANMKRWTDVDNTIKDWTAKLQSMVDVWKAQAETAQKVTAAIAAVPSGGEEGGAAPEMNLQDLEKHLENLKKMFIEKQKMMEQLEKTGGEGGADAAPPASS